MAEDGERLVGSWQKVEDPPCAAQYPAELRFEANGLYFGTTEPPGEFTWWDGGTWRVTAPGRLSLSTANDAVVAYAYALEGELLTITDPDGCRLGYRAT